MRGMNPRRVVSYAELKLTESVQFLHKRFSKVIRSFLDDRMLRPRLSISVTRPYTAGPHRTLYIHDLTGCYQIYKSFTRVVITHVHRLLVLNPNAQAAFAMLRAFVSCWYLYVLQVHTRLKVEIDHVPIRSEIWSRLSAI